MNHHKRSRVGHLPRWQRLSTHIVFGICALSGLGFFLRREMGIELGEIASRSLLIWHGVSAAFALLAFGSVLPGHIRSAWNARRNRGSGVAMLSFMAILMLSGLLLYYGDEEWHESVLWMHWLGGFIAFVVFPLHLILGTRANARHSENMAKNRSTLPAAHSVLR